MRSITNEHRSGDFLPVQLIRAEEHSVETYNPSRYADVILLRIASEHLTRGDEW